MNADVSHTPPAAVSTIARSSETDLTRGARPSGIGAEFTFVVNGCPVRITRRDSMLEVRLVGRAVASNCQQLRRVLLAVLATARPVTLDLRELGHIDVISARMLTRIIEASCGAHRAWTVVNADPHVRTSCAGLHDRSYDSLTEPIPTTQRASFKRAC